MLKSRVREALVTSVACTRPAVRRHSRNESMVPKASSPRSARARAPATLSRIHATLVPEKYGSRSRPVRARTSASAPAARSCAHTGAVRRSCHTIARCSGRPVARSQTTAVSRWLVMPRRADGGARGGGARHDLAHRRERVAPDVLGVVLDPARGRIVLCELAPRERMRARLDVEEDRTRRGRALVDGEYGVAHVGTRAGRAGR